ncbi:uncharacterized protein ACO6RY_19940 [Pungitius sinensis]
MNSLDHLVAVPRGSARGRRVRALGCQSRCAEVRRRAALGCFRRVPSVSRGGWGNAVAAGSGQSWTLGGDVLTETGALGGEPGMREQPGRIPPRHGATHCRQL